MRLRYTVGPVWLTTVAGFVLNLLSMGCGEEPSAPLPDVYAEIDADTRWDGLLTVGGTLGDTLVAISGYGPSVREFPDDSQFGDDISYCAELKKPTAKPTLRFRVVVVTNRDGSIYGAWEEATEPGSLYRACNGKYRSE